MVTQSRCVGPVTYKSEQLDPSTPLFIFVPEVEAVWFCCCVHIAHVSLYCPVDIVCFCIGNFWDFIYFQAGNGRKPADMGDSITYSLAPSNGGEMQ